MIVAVGSIKGGVGKTTLAVNLAICHARRGEDVLLVDGDEQGTARAFTQLRADVLGAPGYTVVSLQGAEIRTQIRLLRVKYDQIIVDVGGRDTSSLRAALTVADILIVPVLPATFDVWSLEPLGELMKEARNINDELAVITFLNAADAQGKDNEEAAAIIRENAGFEYFPHPIVRRKAFRNAAAAGLSVLEIHPPDEKAIDEFTLLANYVFGYAGDIAQQPYAYRKASFNKDENEQQTGRDVHPSRLRASASSGGGGTFHPNANPVSEEPLGSDRPSCQEEGFESKQLATVRRHQRTGH